MKKCLLLVCIALGFHQQGIAQFSRYIVRLKNKTKTPYTLSDPGKFLSQRAIERRTRFNIPIEETDLPINPAYIDSIRLSGAVTILNVSKWLNQVCIQTTDAQALLKINSYSFVFPAMPVAARMAGNINPVNKQLDLPQLPPSPVAARPQSPQDVFDYGLAYPQVRMHNAEFLHNYGFRGEGMQLAIMDAGFYHYQTLPTFDSIVKNKQVLDTWDFVSNDATVNEDHPHGMNCFSTIAANLPGSFVGTAPKSNYLLYRTEDAGSEYPVEEQNFATAAEKADSLGADVFSISLGYNTFDNSTFNYTYSDLDGNTTMSARAADFAARKGILVVVAAGNDGNNSWKYISTPADADSVLTVGAVNASRQAAAFSGYGPTSDNQVKPDVAAVGQGAVVANQVTGEPSYNNGTSFACPIMAGVTTCLWQAFPEVNNMSVIDALRRSADKFASPDVRTGYGIPDAKKAFVLLLKKLFTKDLAIDNSCKAVLTWNVKSGDNMRIIVERKLPADAGYTAVKTEMVSGSFASRSFTFTEDLNNLTGNLAINYRLRMVIGTDTSFYLDSATLNYPGCGATPNAIRVGPNPVTDNLIVVIPGNGANRVSLQLHDVTGRLVYQQTQVLAGTVTMQIPMKHLSKGLYFISVFLDDKKQATRTIRR